MKDKTPPNLNEKVKAALAKDPKRSSIMLGLALLMAVLWWRMLFTGPANATASFIRRSVSAMTDAPASIERGSSSNPVLEWLGQAKKPIGRNLFAVHLDFYARNRATQGGTEVPEDPAKSPTDQADQAREKQILTENLQTQAAGLKLQSTVMGRTPSAVINGQMVKEGDLIDGFLINKIQPRKVDLSQEDVTLQIQMP